MDDVPQKMPPTIGIYAHVVCPLSAYVENRVWVFIEARTQELPFDIRSAGVPETYAWGHFGFSTRHRAPFGMVPRPPQVHTLPPRTHRKGPEEGGRPGALSQVLCSLAVSSRSLSSNCADNVQLFLGFKGNRFHYRTHVLMFFRGQQRKWMLWLFFSQSHTICRGAIGCGRFPFSVCTL